MQLSEQTLDLKKMIADFVDKEIIPVAAEYDKKGEFPVEVLNKINEMDLYCVSIPEQFGGLGLGILDTAIISEELARGDLGIAATIGANTLASIPVLLAGTEEQQKHWFDILKEKHLSSFCLTEPGAGSDASQVSTTAVLDGDEYVINGRKCFVTNGGFSGIYAVVAVTDKSAGTKGLSIFMIERDREGISIGKEEDKMGMRLSNTCDVIFENVRIPASNRIGREGDGFKLAMATLDRTRPCVAAQAVGVAERAMQEAIAYAKERKQFGKPLAAFQVTQFKFADMYIAIETARQMSYHAAELIDAGLGQKAAAESAISKAYAGDVVMKVTTEAVQVLGGYGYMKDYPVEKLMRDAKILQIYEGTGEIQRMVIAGKLLMG